MEKRKLRILTVVVFAGVLIFGALRQNSTRRGELGEIQVAMWNLGKVDNLQLSYEYRWKQNGSAGGETMHAWADMLTGDWISEHYTTDEDGTRLYLKQFCDGRDLYHYIDWSGEWEQIPPPSSRRPRPLRFFHKKHRTSPPVPPDSPIPPLNIPS